MTYLDLSFNNLNNSLRLKQLKKLKSLDLSYNNLSDLKHLEDIKHLTSLNLSSNKNIRSHDVLSNLKELTFIDLSHNNLKNIQFLKGLKELISLNLSYNRLNNIHALKGLEKTTSLYLRYNDIKDISILNEFKKLTSLDLSYNHLKNILHLKDLKHLTSLDLSDNSIQDISPLKGLVHLTSLNLSNNNLNDVKALRELEKLISLDIRNNNLNDVLLLKHLNQLIFLNLTGNPIKTISKSILERGITAVHEFFKQLIKGQENYLFEAKLLILGEPGAGKTSLSRKLKDINAELPKPEETTWGIDVEPLQFTVNKSRISKAVDNEYLDDNITVKINIWDFGGQDIYHATHRFFLSERSLYLLVSDERKEDTDFKYWLQMVEKFGKDSPLIIVQNQKEEKVRELDENMLKGSFRNIKTILPVNFGSIDKRFTKLKNAIEYQICSLPQIGETIPENWKNVRDELEKIESNYISKAEYHSICSKHGITENFTQDLLSSYFHEIGVFLHFRNDIILRNTIFLKPEWVTKAVYTIVESDIAKNEKFGRLKLSDLDKIWQRDNYSDKFIDLVQLMKNFLLIYETDDRNEYVIPQLLKVKKPEYHWDNFDNRIIKYDYKKFMPKGVLWQLIVKLSYYINNDDLVWKQGVILEHEGAKAEVIENNEKGFITIRVCGKHKKQLMTIITGVTDRINNEMNNNNFQKLIPCNCNICKKDENPHNFDYVKLIERLENNREDIECDKPPFNRVNINSLLDDYFFTENTDEMNKFEQDRIIVIEKQFDDLSQQLGKHEKKHLKIIDSVKIKLTQKEIDSINKQIENLQKEIITVFIGKENIMQKQSFDYYDNKLQVEKDRFRKLLKHPTSSKDSVNSYYDYSTKNFITVNDSKQTTIAQNIRESSIDIGEIANKEKLNETQMTRGLEKITKKRIADLEGQLEYLYRLLKEYEENRDLGDDPKQLMKAEKEIENIRKRIEEVKKEYVCISAENSTNLSTNASHNSKEISDKLSNLEILITGAESKIDTIQQTLKEHDQKVAEKLDELQPYLERIEKEINNSEQFGAIEELIVELNDNYEKASMEIVNQIFDWIEENTDELKGYQLKLYQEQKKSDNWKTKAKLKFGLPLAFLHGIDLSVEHEIHLNKWMKKLFGRK